MPGWFRAGENLRLSLEPGEAIGVAGELLGENLKGDLPVQLGVGGLVDLSHAALADESGHVVMAESGADFERMGCQAEIEGIVCRCPGLSSSLYGMARTRRAYALCRASAASRWQDRLG